jgi:hypothetical protein
MNFARFAVALIALAISPISFGKASYLGQSQSTPTSESQGAQSADSTARPVERKITAYTLPPDLYKKAKAAADSFQVEGESFLADPDPNPVNVFLFYDHPPISDRVKLCLTYDPWSKGEQPQFVK